MLRINQLASFERSFAGKPRISFIKLNCASVDSFSNFPQEILIELIFVL